MSARCGRRRQGPALKETHSVSLSSLAVENLRAMGRDSAGKDCLSRGIELAELIARGTPEIRRARLFPVLSHDWIVFEIVDGPADPPRPGEPMRLFKDEADVERPTYIFDPPI